MFEPAGRLHFRGGAGDSDQGDAVVFVVVGDEGDHFVAVGDGAAEEGGVEVRHALQVGGAEHDVSEDCGREHLVAGVVEVEHGLVFAGETDVCFLDILFSLGMTSTLEMDGQEGHTHLTCAIMYVCMYSGVCIVL